ncbi:hypothetical protein PIB30_083207 [Stylosanthes scabra]|uniref:Uncharacterized protein n=1 Tax=Stylosanthes scabra TaxID=79078 RepID=A0ABU6YT00_9FABA|nr:hypothetical protein [Stylosanthes scabra]
MVKPECRVGLPRVVLLAYLLGFWRFIRTENPWVGDSHSVYFRLFKYRFELGKLAKYSSGVFSLASPQFESSVVFCRRISEVYPEYVLGFRMLCNEPGLRSFSFPPHHPNQYHLLKKRNPSVYIGFSSIDNITTVVVVRLLPIPLTSEVVTALPSSLFRVANASRTPPWSSVIVLEQEPMCLAAYSVDPRSLFELPNY